MSKQSPISKESRSWWPGFVIIGAACVFCWPVFLGRVMLPADMCLLMLPWKALQHQFPEFHRAYNPMLDPIQQYLPWRIYAVESLRAGLIPLWNPYVFCGTPFLANLQSTLLYPPNLLFLITGARNGFGVLAILHLSLGGLFLYAFLRSLSLHQVAALFGALVFMFNGYTVAWLEYPTLSLWVFMWLPAILFCYERSRREPRSYWPIFTALVIGIHFLGGHLQVSAYLMMALLLYAAVQALRPAVTARERAGAALLALVPLAIGLLLAAGQILPTLELASHTGRVSHGAAGALRTAFPLTHLILYLVPNFFGNPVDYNYWGSFRDPSAFNFFETACYVGILPLFLTVWAFRRWREPSFWFLAILTGFALLAALGSPLYLLLYHLVPGFRELAGLGRILCLAAFGLAGLAAFGLDELLTRTEKASLRPLLSLAVVAVAAVVVATWGFQPLIAALRPDWQFATYFRWQVVAVICLTLAAGLLLALRARMRLGHRPFALLSVMLLIADLFGFGIRFNPFVDSRMAYPATESIRWLQERAEHGRVSSLASNGLDWMPHNSSMIFGLRDIHGSDSLRVRRSFEMVSPPGVEQSAYPDPESPLFDVLGVKYLITRRVISSKWRLAHDRDTPIYENGDALPRAYVVYSVEAASDEEALAALQADSRRFRDEAVVSPTVAAVLAPLPIEGSDSSTASESWFARDDADAMTIGVRTERNGLLIIADSYYPGWRARVDGKPTPIYRVNYGFRAIGVPAGEHEVELKYEPAAFRAGLFISLLAAAALVAAGFARYLSSRSSASATALRS